MLVFLGFSITDWVKAACAPCQSPGAHRIARPSRRARPPAPLPASPVWMNEATAGPFSQLPTVTLISMYDAPSDKYGTFLPREKWTCEKLWATWGPAILPACVRQKEKSMLFFQRFNGLTPFPFISKAYTTILHVHLWIFYIFKRHLWSGVWESRTRCSKKWVSRRDNFVILCLSDNRWSQKHLYSPFVFYSTADAHTNFISRFILNCPCPIQSFP